MNKKKCPCKKCITLAICINKETAGCEISDEYIGKNYHKQKAQKRIRKTRDALQKNTAIGPNNHIGQGIRFYNIKGVKIEE